MFASWRERFTAFGQTFAPASAIVLAACGGATDATPTGPVATVALDFTIDSLAVGLSRRLLVVAKDSSGNVVSRTPAWSSNDSSVVVVDPNGYATCRRVGAVLVSATIDGITASGTMRCVPIIVVTPELPSLLTGDTTLLTARFVDAFGRALPPYAVTWTSDAPGIAAVAQDGVVSGISAGMAPIRATSTWAEARVDVAVLVPRYGVSREIAYLADSGTASTRHYAWVVNPDGSGRTRVSDPAAHATGIGWSANGFSLLVVYVPLNGQGLSGSYLLKPDAWSGTRITGPMIEPVVSPNGDRVAYSVYGTLSTSLAVVNLDGTDLRTLSPNWGGADYPLAWSPDGRRLLMFHVPQPGGIITYWIARLDDSRLREFRLPAALSATLGQAQWAPDGKRLAFDNGRGVFVVNVDGRSLRSISGNCDTIGQCTEPNYRNPAWSPDGRQLAFGAASETSPPRLIVAESDGPGRSVIDLQLGANAYYPTQVVWSPDGQRFAYTGPAPGPVAWPAIFVMNRDGSGQTRVSGEHNAFPIPRWRP